MGRVEERKKRFVINAPLDGLLSRRGSEKRAKDANTSAVRRAIYFQLEKILLLTTCRIQGEDTATTEFICHASRDD